MAHAYTPGLRVTQKTKMRKKRILPLKGSVIKKEGDWVERNEKVARTELPGNVRIVNVVNLLGITPNEIKDFMLKGPGEEIDKDEVIAESKSWISWFKTRVFSPIKGSIESISPVTGQVLLREPPTPVEVQAYVDGEVVEVVEEEGVVIETCATYVQGILGLGGEVWGELYFAVQTRDELLKPEMLNQSCRDKIIVGGAFASFSTIKKAISLGAKGLIVGGVHDYDLKKLLGYDLGVAITGSENIGITLVLTEGFGKISMADRTFQTLKAREGEQASICGATQIRAGVIRPEIIIPYSQTNDKAIDEEAKGKQSLELGDQVRIIRQPNFGKIGRVSALPVELTKLDSETLARVLEVKLDGGAVVVVPRANIEKIEV